MEYMLRLTQVHETFRLAEINALAVLENIDLEVLSYSPTASEISQLILEPISQVFRAHFALLRYHPRKLRFAWFDGVFSQNPSSKSGAKAAIIRKSTRMFKGYLDISGPSTKMSPSSLPSMPFRDHVPLLNSESL